jgi:3-phenylpropionate/trans-cinnamate dioxygenase ferredoxin subunit
MSAYRPACALADVPAGSAHRVLIDGVPVAVVNTAEGVFAIEDRCSHADVALSEGDVDGCTIECWLHGSAFDLRTGAPLSLPASAPVAVYPARIVGDGTDAVVEIDLTHTNEPAAAG